MLVYERNTVKWKGHYYNIRDKEFLELVPVGTLLYLIENKNFYVKDKEKLKLPEEKSIKFLNETFPNFGAIHGFLTRIKVTYPFVKLLSTMMKKHIRYVLLSKEETIIYTIIRMLIHIKDSNIKQEANSLLVYFNEKKSKISLNTSKTFKKSKKIIL